MHDPTEAYYLNRVDMDGEAENICEQCHEELCVHNFCVNELCLTTDCPVCGDDKAA